MKFTCEKTLLSNAINIAARTVSPKSSLTALEGLYLKADETLQITGFNLETGITVEVEAAVREAGEVIMPTRMFADIIRKLPDDTVSVQVDEKLRVQIRGGISSFQIMASSADDYPELPEVTKDRAVSLPQSALRDLISGTIFAVSENQAKPIHTGCLMEVMGQSVTMVAVDGFRLARKTYHFDQPQDQVLGFVVPSPALKELEKILTDSDELCSFCLGDKHILFQVGGATLVCRLLEGSFLDWRRVIPTNNPIKLVANVSALTATLERVGLIVSEKFKSPVRCLFSKDMADFRTTTTIASAHDCCQLSGDGGEIEIGFNCKYLLDALKVLPTDEICLELSNGLSPIVMTPCDDKYDFAYMILPVRLKAGE